MAERVVPDAGRAGDHWSPFGADWRISGAREWK
jgi:hypothetical protein